MTTLWPSTISLISPVCSPRIAVCFWNIEYVRFEMNPATRKDTGVMTTTASVIFTLTDSMNASVPTMVTTPLKSWVNPISNPSAN